MAINQLIRFGRPKSCQLLIDKVQVRSLELWFGLLSFKLIDAGRCSTEMWSVEPEFERQGRGVSIGLQWFVAVSVCVELLYNSCSYLEKDQPYFLWTCRDKEQA